MTDCVKCGHPMEEELPPMSAMGYRMYGRGLESEKCMNPRCERFGR